MAFVCGLAANKNSGRGGWRRDGGRRYGPSRKRQLRVEERGAASKLAAEGEGDGRDGRDGREGSFTARAGLSASCELREWVSAMG